MASGIILASGSEIRSKLLSGAGVAHSVEIAGIEEGTIRTSLQSEGRGPDEIAHALAQAKAQKISQQHRRDLVIGCDQILDIGGNILSKPANTEDAMTQLRALNGKQHSLHTAVVVFQNGQQRWGFVGRVSLNMRKVSEQYLAGYVRRNWQSIQHSVGCYKLEEEGARLFSRVQGDYFTVLGLPLFELLGYLTDKGVLPG